MQTFSHTSRLFIHSQTLHFRNELINLAARSERIDSTLKWHKKRHKRHGEFDLRVRGKTENTFVVQVKKSSSVAELKRAVKNNRKNSVQCDADELKLHLAVKNDTWLKYSDQAALAVENGAVSSDIQEMIRDEQLDTNWGLSEVLSGDNLKSQKPHQLHVLVVMPTPEPALQEPKQVASKDDALDLLAQALRFVMPEIIEHKLVVADRGSPSTSVFQHELYVSIRDVVGINSKHELFVETGEPDDNRRLGIADARGARDLLYGYELKINQLTKADIMAAVKQANEFRQHLAVGATLLVNFAPRSHGLDEVYRVDGYPDISIVHVHFLASCDEYELRFVGQDSDIASRTIRSSE